MRKGLLALMLTTSLHAVAAGEESAASPWKWSGFIDGSYNNLERQNVFISGVQDRVYDLNPDGTTLQQLAGTVQYTPEQGFGALLNLMLGRDAITTNVDGLGTWIDSNVFGVDLTQVYAQYLTSKLSMYAGKILALNGAETINPTTNTNFSRSFLFGFGGPFTLLGARAAYQATDMVLLTVGVNNGWDTITDFNRKKTLELQASFEFNPMLSYSITILQWRPKSSG